jgi:hypothetical protein
VTGRAAGTRSMKTLLMSMAVLAFGAAALGAQEPPASQPGSSSKATLTVRVEVAPSTGVFQRLSSPAAGARVEPGWIVFQAGQPGQLLVEIWRGRDSLVPAVRGKELVVAAPVRLERDSTGRASGRVPTAMARALEAAAARPSTYTVVVAY